MKKLFTIVPLALGLVITSCGSKDGDKKEGEEKKEERTACDCMQLMLDEVKKIDNMDAMQNLQMELDKKYPECKALVEEMQKSDPVKAAEECPAIGELMTVLTQKMEQMAPPVVEDTNAVDMEAPVE